MIRAARVLALMVLSFAAWSIAPGAFAQAFPSKPIKIVVTFPLGGAPDILARLFGGKMQETWGQPVIVDNRPGAGGNIGADYVAKSPADGYTVVMGTVGTHAINASLYSKMPYDPVRDFAPVILVAQTPNLLVVNNNVPAKTVQELISHAKANPGKVFFGSPGIGTSIHVSGELFNTMAGVKTVHVPYKGRQMAIPDLLGGQIQMMFDNMPTAIKLTQGGRVRGLALTSTARHPLAPDLPTLDASGLPGFDVTAWFGFVAPAGTPRPVIDTLNSEMVKALRDPQVTKNLTALGVDIVANTPEEFRAFIALESKKWKDVVEKSGAKRD